MTMCITIGFFNRAMEFLPYKESSGVLGVMSRDVVLAPARNDTVPIQEVSVQTACH